MTGRFHRRYFQELEGFKRGIDHVVAQAPEVHVGKDHSSDSEIGRVQAAQAKRAKKAAKRAALLAGLILLLCACAGAPTVPQREAAPAVNSQCDAECTTSCLPKDWPQWTGDPLEPSTWDALPEQVIEPLRTLVETCDKHREACVQCLSRIDQVGLTCGTAVKCSASSEAVQ